jgi:hypothetical protein
MKKINVQELLENIQKLSRERTIELFTIERGLQEVDKYLHITLGIKRKNLVDTVVYFDANAQLFAKAYNGIPQSTHVTAKYDKRGHIEVIAIYREKCATKRFIIVFSESAKPDIIEKMSRKD